MKRAFRWAWLLLGATGALGGCGGSRTPSSNDGPDASGASGGGAAGDAAAGAAGMGAGGGAGQSAGTGGSSAAGGSAGATDAGPADNDGDGIDDKLEATLAASYFPFYSIDPADGCPRHGVLFRLSPHPDDSTKIMIWYDVLYEHDCGAAGHVGDDEMFGVVADPAQPAPGGILAVRAISHQGTLCEKTTTCGTLPNCSACTTAQKSGASYPIVYSSKDKHGSYADKGTCSLNFICDFGGCTLAPQGDTPIFVNAGEPGAPLVGDLTTEGFVNAAQGWTESALMHFDPWGGADFGGAGSVTGDLTDTSFVVPLSGC